MTSPPQAVPDSAVKCSGSWLIYDELPRLILGARVAYSVSERDEVEFTMQPILDASAEPLVLTLQDASVATLFRTFMSYLRKSDPITTPRFPKDEEE